MVGAKGGGKVRPSIRGMKSRAKSVGVSEIRVASASGTKVTDTSGVNGAFRLANGGAGVPKSILEELKLLK